MRYPDHLELNKRKPFFESFGPKGVATLVLAALLLCAAPLLATNQDDSSMLADAVLEIEVKTRLLQKIGWDMLTVDVEAAGSEITLAGEVENKSHQELAKEVALSVDGVEKVHNHLKAEAPKSSDTPVGDAVANAETEVKDALLESRVKSKLIAELGRNAFGIEVEAADGEVSLRGQLADSTIEKRALQVVESCEGVEKVVDLLTVES